MKKIILSLALIIAGTTAFSQVSFKPGARTGANFAKVSNLNGDTKTDFYFGAFGELKLSSFYALQPEINYSRQGIKSKVSGGRDTELQYVGLSLANKFYPITDLGLHILVGPGLDVKVSDNIDSNYFDTAPIDFVFFGGIGYDFPFGLSVEARYKQGTIDIDDGETLIGSSNNSYNNDNNNLNGVFQIGVSYKFDFSK